jgi:hypothetical protein
MMKTPWWCEFGVASVGGEVRRGEDRRGKKKKKRKIFKKEARETVFSAS